MQSHAIKNEPVTGRRTKRPVFYPAEQENELHCFAEKKETTLNYFLLGELYIKHK